MAGFATSQEAMAAGAAHVDDAIQQCQGHIGALRSEVETLMAGWGGSAATAFSGVHANFEAQAKKINDNLQQMHEALVSSRATYAAQEEQESQGMASLATQINEM